ncbi:DUF4188 domain-containing protein [Streptomyces sp. JNUCC 64]
MGVELIEGRVAADAEGEVVVFLIGMRINRWRAVRDWLPAARAMPAMIRELVADPASGLLGHQRLRGGARLFYLVQYWESREKLLGYAARPDALHRPAWAAFNRRVRDGRGSVGVWHETYVVPAGAHESIYVDMPAFGLGAVHGTVPVERRGNRARERFAAG